MQNVCKLALPVSSPLAIGFLAVDVIPFDGAHSVCIAYRSNRQIDDTARTASSQLVQEQVRQ